MGACCSNRIKDGTPVHTGVSSKNVSKDGTDLSRSSSKFSTTSIPQTPRTEGEILEASNLKSFSFNELRTVTRNFRPDSVLGEDGTDLSRSSSKFSTTSIPGEILEASNLKSFSFNELRTATRNFHPDSVLGEGAFGSVFKGWIDEHSLMAAKPGSGMAVAVKRLNQDGFQGHREWLAEINYLGRLQHPNLVKLIGYCLEDEHRLLVYEFMPNGSMEDHLFRRGSYFQPLSLSVRMEVATGAARALEFLHNVEKQVIYRDFKTSNILLDSNYNAKLSDFGLARDGPTGDKTHVSTRVLGTRVFIDPEYLSTGHLTAGSDVYSFGVVLVEMLFGRRAFDIINSPSGEHNLLDWAKPYLTNRHKLFHVIDTRLEGQYSLDQAQLAAMLAVQCLSKVRRARPRMSEVVCTLEWICDKRQVEKYSKRAAFESSGPIQ